MCYPKRNYVGVSKSKTRVFVLVLVGEIMCSWENDNMVVAHSLNVDPDRGFQNQFMDQDHRTTPQMPQEPFLGQGLLFCLFEGGCKVSSGTSQLV